MIGIPQLRAARKKLGLSQAALARIADVSLPTIQNIESGRNVNPSIQVVQALLAAVGLEIKIAPEPVDWDLLAHFGVPISSRSLQPLRPPPTGPELANHLSKACLHLNSGDQAEQRYHDALSAALFALQSGFPTFFKNNLAGRPSVAPFMPTRITGRLLKLRRIALARFSNYL